MRADGNETVEEANQLSTSAMVPAGIGIRECASRTWIWGGAIRGVSD